MKKRHKYIRIGWRNLLVADLFLSTCVLLAVAIVYLRRDLAVKIIEEETNKICQAIVDGRSDVLLEKGPLKGDEYHVKWLSKYRDVLAGGYKVTVKRNGVDGQLLSLDAVTHVATIRAGDHSYRLSLALGFHCDAEGRIVFVAAASTGIGPGVPVP